MQTYVFQVELEPDGKGWRAFYPAWEKLGASTWGYTKEEARQNIQEVLSLIIEEFEEDGEPVPATEGMIGLEGEAVTVTV